MLNITWQTNIFVIFKMLLTQQDVLKTQKLDLFNIFQVVLHTVKP